MNLRDNLEAWDKLDVLHPSTALGAKRLAGLRMIVIGAGPAGLTVARRAAEQGAIVTVLEKAGDPAGSDPGYTNRSFNITLYDAGRAVLGHESAWRGGIWLKGRALHRPEQVRYGSYGEKDSHLVCIPRPVLRKNMAVLAREAGAQLVFDAAVTRMDADGGVVWYEMKGEKRRLTADLVVTSDGLHSLGDGASLLAEKRREPREYVTGTLRADYDHGLSLEHIHFWHEDGKEAYAIGLPNGDGSVELLLTSAFEGIAPGEHPFATPEAAAERLARDYPQLYELAPQLAGQLPKRRRGRFHYKLVRSFVLGRRGVVVGDAGCAVPPWAGFGANAAMYAAASLVYQLVEYGGDVAAALEVYEAQQLALGGLIMDFVSDQGEFLSGPVAKNPDGRADTMLPLVRRAREIARQRVSTPA